jgi:ribosomal protein S8
VKSGNGLLVLSTPNGVRAGHEAKREKVGGQMLFEIW